MVAQGWFSPTGIRCNSIDGHTARIETTDNPHIMCDVDIARLGRENDALRIEVMVLRAVIAELGVNLRQPESGTDQGAG